MTRDEAINILRNTAWLGTEDKVTEALETIERKGSWMPNNVIDAVCPWCCSECNSNQMMRTPYCKMCGARMEVEP